MEQSTTPSEPSTDEKRAINAFEDVVAVEQHAPGMVRVVTWSDAYVVDARDGGCMCPDKEYNEVPICKHEVAALASDVDRLPNAGMVVDNLNERVATDGGEPDRPDECMCWDAEQALPCIYCYTEGFETPNPETPGDGDVSDFDPADYDSVSDALADMPPGYDTEDILNHFDPVVDTEEVDAETPSPEDRMEWEHEPYRNFGGDTA